MARCESVVITEKCQRQGIVRVRACLLLVREGTLEETRRLAEGLLWREAAQVDPSLIAGDDLARRVWLGDDCCTL